MLLQLTRAILVVSTDPSKICYINGPGQDMFLELTWARLVV